MQLKELKSNGQEKKIFKVPGPASSIRNLNTLITTLYVYMVSLILLLKEKKYRL